MNFRASYIPPAPDRLAADLRGFGPLGIIAILVILSGNLLAPPLSAILALIWVWRSGTPWKEIGYVRPKSWAMSIIAGFVCGVFFKLLMKSVVMPLLGAPPVNQAYHYIAGNTAMLPFIIIAIIIYAGFGEETIFRGYLFERLGKIFGKGMIAKTIIIVLTSALFGIDHFRDQGLAGTEQAFIVGLVFGTVYAFTGRIFPLMVAHVAFDLAAVAIIYLDLETTLAHFVFN